MNNILFINVTEIKNKSIISVNTDEKIITGALLEVQELELLPLIGKKLYRKLQDEIYSASTISGYQIEAKNKEILDDYIKDFLIYGTLVYSVVPLHFKLNNKGLNTSTDTNLSVADPKALESFKNHYKEKFDSYKRRLIDFFACDNNPETNTSSNQDTTSSILGFSMPDYNDDSAEIFKSRAYKTSYYRRY